MRLVSEINLTCFVVHTFNNCKRFNLNTLASEFIATVLKTFFNYDTATSKWSTAVINKADKTFKCITDCKKVINNKNFIIFIKKSLWYNNIICSAMSEAFNLWSVNITGNIFSFSFFSKNQRAAEFLCNKSTDSYTRSFDSKDFINTFIFKQTVKFFGNLLHKRNINSVI